MNTRIFLLMILLFLAGCQSAPDAVLDIPFDTLVADPGKYDGEFFCTEGIYLSGFEISALGAATYERDGFLYLTEPVIWIERADVKTQAECTSFQGYQFCPVQVCGRFKFGGSYGHLGGYKYQIESTQTE